MNLILTGKVCGQALWGKLMSRKRRWGRAESTERWESGRIWRVFNNHAIFYRKIDDFMMAVVCSDCATSNGVSTNFLKVKTMIRQLRADLAVDVCRPSYSRDDESRFHPWLFELHKNTNRFSRKHLQLLSALFTNISRLMIGTVWIIWANLR